MLQSHNIIIPFYMSWLYIVSSYYDYLKNIDAYKKIDFSNKIHIIFKNVFIYMPISLYIILTICPIQHTFHSIYHELFHIFLNIVFGEIWFYTLHRMLHTKYLYKYHKTHHEIKDTVGLFALYAHPFDAIIVNMGSIYILHLLLRFSSVQIYLVGTYATINTIVHSHSSIHKNLSHQIHHLKFNVNYGLDLFMDKLFHTKSNV
jgi:sterol desaturase/sphingolipid hydroxylase (fatty acid hydroxylase superfamily)